MYYTGNPQFGDVSGDLLFRLAVKTIEALPYLSLYKFLLQAETDPLLLVFAMRRFMEADWEKTATKDGLVR